VAGSAALQAPDWSRFQLPNRLLFHAFTGPRDRLKNDPESVPMAYLKPVRQNVSPLVMTPREIGSVKTVPQAMPRIEVKVFLQ